MDDRQKIDGFKVEEFVMNILNINVFVSFEVLLELLYKEGIEVDNSDMDCIIDYSFDVWLLVCVLIRFIIGK